MNKGISFNFGFIYDNIEEQVKAIKDAGFDCVITNADTNLDRQNGNIKLQVKLFKKYGLKLSSLHMRYKKEELPHFWHDNPTGKKLEKNLIKDVKIAKKYGFTCVVVHLRGEPNEIGYDRLKRVLKVCEKLDIPLAIENIGNSHCFDKAFANVDSPYLRFCYDSGHHNAFDPQVDYLGRYGKKLITLHLHDNLGPNPSEKQLKGLTCKKQSLDMHTLNKYGSIDWENIATQLAKIDYPLSLDYEMLLTYSKGETPEQVLKETYKQACKLEKMIEERKKQNETNNDRHKK